MVDVVMEREFDAPASRVFDLVTLPQNMVRWWGHDGLWIKEAQLDMTREGPWHSTMTGEDGSDRKVSGEVTAVDPPHEVSFTWGWHDENDARGPESHVTIQIVEIGERKARLVLHHKGLSSDEAATGHTRGWTALLNKLELGLA